jgi:hypothetical protein
MNDVRIVLARCAEIKSSFGIRVENAGPSRWVLTWAFPVLEVTARREGYDRSEITGHFEFQPDYPGCPHCSNRSFFRCRCGKIACWDAIEQDVTCPWCGAYVRLEGTVDRMSAGQDR